MRALWRVFWILILAVLAGCGGGGGSSANGDFQLSSSALYFNGSTSSYIPSQSLIMSSIGSGAYYIGAGAPTGSTLPDWLSVATLSSTTGFSVSVMPYGLSPGTRTTVLRVATGDVNGNIMSYRDVPITFTLTAGSVTPTPTYSPFVTSTTTPTRAPTTTSTTTPSSTPTTTPTATPTPTGVLNVSAASVTLGGTTGRAHATPVGLTLSTNLAGSYAWSVQSKPSWLQLSKSSGTLSSSDEVSLSANLGALNVGMQAGSLVLQSTMNGSVQTRAVTVIANLDQRKLIASETGVALSKTPSWSRLSRTITVRDNFGAGGWTASSDQSWLTVTSSGNSGDALTLTANPTGLSQDVIRTANVTLTSTSGAASETVVVGLWNGSTTPSAVISVAGAYKTVVADPVRPLAYANTGGSTITIFNVYSGSSVGTINIPAATLGHMEVSPDGKRLYALNSGSVIKEIDLTASSPTVLGSWTLPLASTPAQELKYVRPNGEGMLVAQASTSAVLKAKDGSLQTTTGSFYLYRGLAVSPDQTSLLTPFTRHRLEYSASNPILQFSSASLAGSCAASGSDVAVAKDSSFAVFGCVSNSQPYYGFHRASLADTSVAMGYFSGAAYPNNTEVASDGKYLLGAMYGTSNVADVWVYRSDNTLLTSFWLGGYLVDRELKVSGDSFVGVALVGTGQIASTPFIKFLPIGPDTASAGVKFKNRSGGGSAFGGVTSTKRIR